MGNDLQSNDETRSMWIREEDWSDRNRNRIADARKEALRRLNDSQQTQVFAGSILKLGRVLKQWKMRYAILTTKCLAIYEPQETATKYVFKTLMELDVVTLNVTENGDGGVFTVRGSGKRYKSVSDKDNNDVTMKLKVHDKFSRQRWIDMINRANETAIQTARTQTSEIFRKVGQFPDTPKMIPTTNKTEDDTKGTKVSTAATMTKQDVSSKTIDGEIEFNAPMTPLELPTSKDEGVEDKHSPESSTSRPRTKSDQSENNLSTTSGNSFLSTSESSRSFLGGSSISSSSLNGSNETEPVLKSGRLMKLKKGGTDKWKSVELKLRPSSLEYSYQKKMALMMPWTVRHKVRLQDVEQIIEDPLRPKYFTIDMLIGTPIPLRATSSDQAQSWIQIIRNALRPHQELMAARNQELDCVSSSALLDNPRGVSNGEEDEDNMTTIDNIKPSDLMDLGFMWKKSKVWKEWRIRRFRLEPTMGLLQYSRPEDPEGLSQTEHWFIKGGRVEPVDVNYSIDLYCAHEQKGKPNTVLSVRCISGDDMVRNLLALKNAGATLCGCLDVYNHLSEKYINDVSIRLEKRLKKLTYDRTWPRDTSDAIARYLSLTALRTTKNSPQGSVKMRIDLARGAAILQRRASFKPVDLAMGCMVVNGTRQRLILRGFFLEAFAPEAHFLSNQQQKDDVVVCTARYVIRGAAVLMVDAWKSTVKIECRKADEAERSEIGAKAVLNIQAEMGIEQLYTLLHLSRKHGALLDDHCALLYSFVKKLRSDPESLSNVMEKVETLDRERVAKRGDIWVPLASVVTNKLELASLMSNIAAEFKSRDFQRNYFELATMHAGGKRNSGDLRSGRFSNRRRQSSTTSVSSATSTDQTSSSSSSSPPKRIVSTNSIHTSLEEHNVSGRIAIIVLGPSAAGKTHQTQVNLCEVLKANSLPGDLSFVSIDGGIMRNASKWWKHAKDLRLKEKRPVKGFSDLHKGYFQTHLRAFKRKVFSSLLERGVNMVIPDTAAQVMSDRVGSYLKRLKQHKYTVVMTAVHATRETCNRNGKRREVEEGKKYSNFSWPYAMKSIDKYFNLCRSMGWHKESFFIIDNTDWNKNKMMLIEPRRGVQLELISNNHDDMGIFQVKELASVPFSRQGSGLRDSQKAAMSRISRRLSGSIVSKGGRKISVDSRKTSIDSRKSSVDSLRNVSVTSYASEVDEEKKQDAPLEL